MTDRTITVRGGIGMPIVKMECNFFYRIDYDTRAGLARRILRAWSYVTGLSWEGWAFEDLSEMKGNEKYFHFKTKGSPIHCQGGLEFYLEREEDDAKL